MSVISTWEAVPSRVEQLWRFLADAGEKGVPEDRLAFFFSPPSMDKEEETAQAGGNIHTGVLAESLKLGLLERIEDGVGDRIKVAVSPPKGIKKSQVGSWFVDHLRWLLTSPEEAVAKNQDQVPLALAWFTLQSPLFPLPFSKNLAHKLKDEFPENDNGLGLKDNASLQQGFYWARYLGLCTFIAQPKRGSSSGAERIVVPDPTRALRRLVPVVFEDETELPALEFLDRLGELCPILEHGEARRQLMKQASDPSRFPSLDTVSPATSLALARLKEEGIIAITANDDAPNPCIQSINGTEKSSFSHVSYKGGRNGV